jgi:hypothetical protein
MSATIARIGYGISLSHSTTSGGSYTAFAEILSITPPGVKVDVVNIYRSDNTSAVVERIPGWTEIQDVEMEITYNPAMRTVIEGLSGVPAFYKVTYPLVGSQNSVGDVDLIAGFISEIGKETPLKSNMTSKIKISVSGAITYTQGS